MSDLMTGVCIALPVLFFAVIIVSIMGATAEALGALLVVLVVVLLVYSYFDKDDKKEKGKTQ